MKAMTLAVGVLCAIPLAGIARSFHAQGTAAGATTSQVDALRTLDSDPSRRRQIEKAKEFRPTDQQIADAEAFIEKYSPNRFRAYKKVREAGGGPHLNLKRAIARNYLELRAIETADAALFAMKMEELKIEDDIFGIVAMARESGEKGDRVRAAIRPKVLELETNKKEQMLHRIEKMKAAMVAEQKKFDDMNDGSDRWINQRVNEEINRGGRLVPPVASRRGINAPTTAEN